MYQSRTVESNQNGVHENLKAQVEKHLTKPFKKPVAEHTQQAFSLFEKTYSSCGRDHLILDACCGVGDSSRKIARMFPDHFVVGVDRSESRLSRQRGDESSMEALDNLLLLRADLMDFYRLLLDGGYRLDRHYLLYPNPYPKAAQIGKRWHGSPAFPSIVALGGKLDVRSNWSIYIEEFAEALSIVGLSAQNSEYVPNEGDYWTMFEKKYHQSGQQLWQLTCDLVGERT